MINSLHAEAELITDEHAKEAAGRGNIMAKEVIVTCWNTVSYDVFLLWIRLIITSWKKLLEIITVLPFYKIWDLIFIGNSWPINSCKFCLILSKYFLVRCLKYYLNTGYHLKLTFFFLKKAKYSIAYFKINIYINV